MSPYMVNEDEDVCWKARYQIQLKEQVKTISHAKMGAIIDYVAGIGNSPFSHSLLLASCLCTSHVLVSEPKRLQIVSLEFWSCHRPHTYSDSTVQQLQSGVEVSEYGILGGVASLKTFP